MVIPFKHIRDAEAVVCARLRDKSMDREAAIAYLIQAGVARPRAVHFVGLEMKLIGPDPHPNRII